MTLPSREYAAIRARAFARSADKIERLRRLAAEGSPLARIAVNIIDRSPDGIGVSGIAEIALADIDAGRDCEVPCLSCAVPAEDLRSTCATCVWHPDDPVTVDGPDAAEVVKTYPPTLTVED